MSTIASPRTIAAPLLLLIVAGCILAAVTNGIRTSFGLLTLPMAGDLGLSPRGLGHGHGHPEPRLGHCPALRRRVRRPLRHGQGDRRRPPRLRSRPRPDGGVAHRHAAQPHRRHRRRRRYRHLVLFHRHGRLRPQRAAGEAEPRVRRRDRRLLARPVRLRPHRPGLHQQLRLAEHPRLCRGAAGAGDSPDLCAARPHRAPRRAGRPALHAGAEPGLGPWFLPAPRHRLLRLRLPPRLHQRAHAGLSGAVRPAARKSAAGRSR